MKKYKILLLIIAVSMATTIISGCGKMSEIDNSSSKLADGEIQLSFYYPNDSQAGLSDVNDKINEMLKSRLGASVKLNLIDNKAYDQKISGMISSGEEFDICWTSGGNGFYQNAAAGAFLELDKLIDEYGKGTKAGIPDFVWPAAKVDGKIYAVPNYQTMAPGFGLLFRRDFADEMKFDWRSVNKLADIEPYLKFVKEKHPEIIAPLASPGGIISTTILSYSIYFGMDVIGDKTTPGWIYIDNKDDIKVINQFESPEMMEFLRLKRSWYEKGYIRKDAATFTDTISEKRAQQIGSSYGGVDIDTIDWEREGFDYPGRTMPFCGLLGYDKKLGDTLLNTDRAAATLLAISSTSKHPEIAMKLIELLNTDVELYNTLCWGVEGKHYKKNLLIWLRLYPEEDMKFTATGNLATS